ncbi:MAG: PLDc N-terminal domain-containing protein [Vallitaleaceae bacterium]|nr:PLDc N-terminal domain-containing protein [Vallitaleaceae bacterium]
MEQMIQYLPLLAPIALIQIILLIVALVHILKNKKVKFLNLPAWIVIIVVFNIVGPILYLTIGKADE